MKNMLRPDAGTAHHFAQAKPISSQSRCSNPSIGLDEPFAELFAKHLLLLIIYSRGDLAGKIVHHFLRE